MTVEGFSSLFRLDRSNAVEIVADMFNRSVERCEELAGVSHPKAYPPPVFTRLISEDTLESIRSNILEIARSHGFPGRKKSKDHQLSVFDAEVGNYLVEALGISPAEAGMEETWNFFTLVLLPDVAAWRFRNGSKNPEYDRWIGKPRNVFRKAWWRAYCLGPELNLSIGEDEGVNIMERPTFGLNPVLAKSIVNAHLEFSADSEFAKSELLRLVMVQLGKLSAIINLDALPEDQVDTLIRSSYLETIEKAQEALQNEGSLQ